MTHELGEKIDNTMKSLSTEDIGGGCLSKALDLYDSFGGGELYWIGSLEKIGLDYGLHHTYFIPPDANDSSLAMNQKDNGFSQYPALNVAEVRFLGTKQDPSVVREMVNAGKKQKS